MKKIVKKTKASQIVFQLLIQFLKITNQIHQLMGLQFIQIILIKMMNLILMVFGLVQNKKISSTV
jgi:hypothetical protein